ncbi:hypothetical protein [Neorhizobium sp. T6_25]|uniref:hypothetical protein n=1 Tax=Neorhizobium sp. T6_25 TaxID=2093833 RepID=UPI000CF88F71|nr:hypothetical protein [Neorhizobium sp. T6_25]
MRKYNAENTTGEVAVGLSTIESTVHAAAATDRVTECIDLLALDVAKPEMMVSWITSAIDRQRATARMA